MDRVTTAAAIAALLLAHPLLAQTTRNPFPSGIAQDEGIVTVRIVEFAAVPDVDGAAARMMLLVDEPGTGRLFVNDMRGPLYGLSYDGRTLTRYVDINDPAWGVTVESGGRERGFQSFAFHPDFGREGSAGYGKFYVWTDTPSRRTDTDFRPGGGDDTHHTVLLEWTARDPAAPTYDGGPPREIARFEQPFRNHNGGHIAFDPLAEPGTEEYGLLYVGVADGGSGGDPLKLAQDLGSPFGKILRIDPLGSDTRRGRYGIPSGNPYASDGDPGTLAEIWISGVRNPQRFGWDPTTGHVYVADIGQGSVEEISVATAGANLGWSLWEGSFRYADRGGVDRSDPRADPALTYPVAEYAHGDPLILNRAAVTGVHVYRDDAIPQLRDRVLFGDFPSGEVFHFDADDVPHGGNQGFHRVLFRSGDEVKTFLQLIQEKNLEQGRTPARRADLRFGAGPDGQVFLLNKHDGTIRLLVPGA
ncbi:MAG: PQQ-dependent sugar dehydrogenase [Gemmatimonadota bacterium]